MEKEKNDEKSPRGVLEACMKSLESKNTPPKPMVSKDNAPKHGEPQKSRFSSKAIWGSLFKKWRNKPLKRIPSINPFAQKMTGRKSKSSRENPILKELCKFKSSLATFTISDLKAATDDFSEGVLSLTRSLANDFSFRPLVHYIWRIQCI